MEWQTNKIDTPRLKIEFDNGMGDKTGADLTLSGQSLDDVMDAIRGALIAFGFNAEDVLERIPEK